MLASQLTSPWLSLSFFLLVLNIPFFLLGLKQEGKTFTIKAIYAVIIFSIAAWLITDVLPIDVRFASPLAGTDLLLCAVFGGMISGFGSGLAIRFGGALDGIDVLAVLVSKRVDLSVGSLVMAYNVLLYVACGCVLHSWILPLYSIITYMAASKTVDFVVEGIDRNKAAWIVTSHADEICQALSDTFETGMTILDVKSYYSNENRAMIYIIVNRFQIQKIRHMVYQYDKKAHISISEIADVFKK